MFIHLLIYLCSILGRSGRWSLSYW